MSITSISCPRRTMDIRTYLKQAKSGADSVKYTAESGKTHRIYIPFVNATQKDESTGELVTFQTSVSEGHAVHEWTGKDGKFDSALCLTEQGQPCPFCARVSDAWDIYKHRYDMEKNAYLAQGMTEEQANYEMEGDKEKKVGGKKGRKLALLDQRKMKETNYYFYMLVAQFEIDAQGNAVCDAGMPKFELKVMKMSKSRTEKILKMVDAAGGNLNGQELKIDYPPTDDPAERVGQSTVSLVFPDFKFTTQFPGLAEKINEEAAQFSWDNIEKSFKELTVYSGDAAEDICNKNFATWDDYKRELAVNPGAKYLEYATAADKPAIQAGVPTPQIGSATPGVPMPSIMAPNGNIGAPINPVAGAPITPPAGATVTPPASVGAPVGAPVAPPVGATVGAPVGAPVAPPVGATVGAPATSATPAAPTAPAAPVAPEAPATPVVPPTGAPVQLQV